MEIVVMNIYRISTNQSWERIEKVAGWYPNINFALFEKFLSSLGYVKQPRSGSAGSHFRYKNRFSGNTLTCTKSNDDSIIHGLIIEKMMEGMPEDERQKTADFLKLSRKQMKRFLREEQKQKDSPLEMPMGTSPVEEPGQADESWKDQPWYIEQQKAMGNPI